MIAYLKGRVLAMTAETAIIEVGGVGYELYCSGSAFRKMSAGEVVEVYTYLQVKEDGVTLFGFSTPQEKDLFLKITSVPNVGPKLGISVLTCLTADEFLTAVATADVKKLSTVKGLGKKTAEKNRTRTARQNFGGGGYERLGRRFNRPHGNGNAKPFQGR